MLKRYCAALLLLLFACALASAQTPAMDHWIAIRADRLFQAKSEKLTNNQVVLIHGDHISEVGSANRVKVPAGAEVVGLSRATVLPGLIDAHTHVLGNGLNTFHRGGDNDVKQVSLDGVRAASRIRAYRSFNRS